MGITGAIIALAVFGIALLIAYPFIQGGLDDFFAKVNAQKQATLQKPQPKSGETICDLHITTYGELNEDIPIFGKPLFIKLGTGTKHPEKFKYSWTDCSELSTYSLTDMWNTNSLNSLAFFISGEKISNQIVLHDKANPTKKFDANTPSYEHLKYDHVLQGGIIPTPYDLYHEFYIQNIPERPYTIDIYYGRQLSIDDGKSLLDVSQPYTSQICPRGKTSC